MELFLESKEYKTMKQKYEVEHFKLFGKYCKYNGNTISEKSVSEISEYFKNKKITIDYIENQTTKKGTTISTTKELTKNFYQIWSEDPDMKEYEEVVFNCNVSKVKPTQFNLFDGFKQFDNLPKTQVDLTDIFEHIKSLVDYNEEHFEYTLNYFAQLVQYPHVLPHTTLIFISNEGVGKDIFASFLSECIGDKYSYNTEKLDLICGKFNTVLGGKLLMVVNETNPVESRERIENIKYLITAEKISIESKYKDPVKSDNYCRFIFFSNRLFAFPVEGSGSRRPTIFKSSSKYLPDNIGKEENKKYFTNLVNKYKNPQYQKAFLEFLKNRDISNFNPKNINKSELHKELEDNSVSPIVEFLANIVINSDKKVKRLTTTETLNQYNCFLKDRNLKYDCSQTKFNVEMVSTYNIKKIKSCGLMYFEFDIDSLKKYLQTKFKYVFENDVDILPKEPNPLDGEPDYKKLFEEQQEEIYRLKQEIEKLNKSSKNKSKVKVEEPKQKELTDEELELELSLLTK